MSKLYELLYCPFCGGLATMEPWHGGGPRKVMVHCENDDCDVQPSVTGETPLAGANKWNLRRAPRFAKNGVTGTSVPAPAFHKARP